MVVSFTRLRTYLKNSFRALFSHLLIYTARHTYSLAYNHLTFHLHSHNGAFSHTQAQPNKHQIKLQSLTHTAPIFLAEFCVQPSSKLLTHATSVKLFLSLSEVPSMNHHSTLYPTRRLITPGKFIYYIFRFYIIKLIYTCFHQRN